MHFVVYIDIFSKFLCKGPEDGLIRPKLVAYIIALKQNLQVVSDGDNIYFC